MTKEIVYKQSHVTVSTDRWSY